MPVGRKRWNLHDGPQGSLRRLRSQLAEDGCAESQVVLAKQLLEEKCELEADKISNFKQALDWLICATEQAHPEARRMLRRCIRSGVIDEQSAAIVRAKSCLAASRQETVARKAARDLFASLSNGEQYITTAQLERRIREICNTTLRKDEDSDTPDEDQLDEACALKDGQALEPSPEAGDQPHGNGTIWPADTTNDYPDTCHNREEIRNLNVDNLVAAAVDYCQGELPLISHELSLTDPSLKALDNIPVLQQAFLHPLVFINVLYLKLLYYFGSFKFRLSNIELSLLLVGYLSVNTEGFYHMVPLVFYYISFVAMVVCTFKMLHAKRQFVDFRKWSGLFLRYSDGNLQPDESENLFVRNNLGPFVQFFLALFVNLFLYPFIATQWVPFSEFCVLSFFLMFLTLFTFGTNGNPYPDVLALISFAINVLAKYPYEKDTVVHQGWRFLDLQIANYPSYILGNSVEFCLNARMFFCLLIPLILLSMARRDNWQGFLKYALPHFVTLSWLQMFIVCSHGSTAYGLIRGTLGLVGAFLFLPIVGLATLMLPVVAFLQYLTLPKMAYALSVVFGMVIYLGVTCVLAKTETAKKFVTPFQLAIGLTTLLYFGNQFALTIQDDGLATRLIELIGVEDKTSLKSLLKMDFLTDYEENTYFVNWEDYYTQCNSPSWQDNNVVLTQIKCSVLDGASVNWEGYVMDVKLRNVENRWSDIIAWMPFSLQELLKCYYGDEYASEGEFVTRAAQHSGKSCHLNNLNKYTYEIHLIMEASGGLLKRHAEITLLYDHYFTNYTRLLRSNDKIRFKGVLSNHAGSFNIGTKDLQIQGYEITCVECKEATGTISSKIPLSKFSKLVKTLVNDCVVSTKYILNFLFNPIVFFK